MFSFIHWRSLFRRRVFEQDMTEEFAFHLQARVDDLIRAGLSPAEAAGRARLEFGARARFQEECRESQCVYWTDELLRNGRHAWRNLLKSPLFALTGIASLALGLTAVGITFAVVDTVLLRPLPYEQSDRVVAISQKVPLLGASPTIVTPGEFVRWQKSGLFESAAIVDTAAFTLERGGHPERIYGASVTPDFFRVFQLQPIAGRAFVGGDAIEGRSDVIVLSCRKNP